MEPASLQIGDIRVSTQPLARPTKALVESRVIIRLLLGPAETYCCVTIIMTYTYNKKVSVAFVLVPVLVLILILVTPHIPGIQNEWK